MTSSAQEGGEHKAIYRFSDPLPARDSISLLGRKAKGLHTMSAMGIPVPEGFTLTTEIGRHVLEHDAWPENFLNQLDTAVKNLERETGLGFGNSDKPLVISVRSGAAVSMPGMLDTVLNIGLNDAIVEAMAKDSKRARFAYDAYRRLLEMYATIVLGISRHGFSRIREQHQISELETEANALKELVSAYQELIQDKSAQGLPQDPREQLHHAIKAVLCSWNNPRAQRYREMHGISDSGAVACSVQRMVFGNLDPSSGSGVALTRNPTNGKRQLSGEYLANVQGEDVVAGTHTPLRLRASVAPPGEETRTLERSLPDVFRELEAQGLKLEQHFRQVQEMEFTVEQGELYILQTRPGKQSAEAQVKSAVDMVEEQLIDQREALSRIEPTALQRLLLPELPNPRVLEEQDIQPLVRGLAASPGAATGRVVLDSSKAVELAEKGLDVILVRSDTSPEDIHGMKAARGIVAAAGGLTSHAAVVARGLGRCCVVGCNGLSIDLAKGNVHVAGSDLVFNESDVITIDGTRGLIYQGVVGLEAHAQLPELERLLSWADQTRRIQVHASVTQARHATLALSYGAESIAILIPAKDWKERHFEISALAKELSASTQGKTPVRIGIELSALEIAEAKAELNADVEVVAIDSETLFKQGDGETFRNLLNSTLDQVKRMYPSAEVGICGKQSADSQLLNFIAQLGISQLWCAPDQVPLARLAAARAELTSGTATAQDG